MSFHKESRPGSLAAVNDGFATVVSSHHAEIYRYLLRATGRRSDADDLSQETFLHAYRALSSLPGDANLKAWLFAIATNLARKHFRGQGRQRRAYDAVSAGARDQARTDPEQALAGRELGEAIEAVVATLPFKQRAAFLQRKVHGLEYDAVAQALDCSEESARAHVFQALRKIRTALDGHDFA